MSASEHWSVKLHISCKTISLPKHVPRASQKLVFEAFWTKSAQAAFRDFWAQHPVREYTFFVCHAGEYKEGTWLSAIRADGAAHLCFMSDSTWLFAKVAKSMPLLRFTSESTRLSAKRADSTALLRFMSESTRLYEKLADSTAPLRFTSEST